MLLCTWTYNAHFKRENDEPLTPLEVREYAEWIKDGCPRYTTTAQDDAAVAAVFRRWGESYLGSADVPVIKLKR